MFHGAQLLQIAQSRMAELFLRPLFTWRSAVASKFGPESPTTRHVLLTLSIHMNEKGESCYPSTKLLADETGLSERSVCTHLELAEKSGWIMRKSRQRPGQQWRQHVYSPVIPIGVEGAIQKDELLNDVQQLKGTERRSAASIKGTERGAEATERDDKKVLKDVQCSTSLSTSGSVAATASPSPVSLAFKAYAEGIKNAYGADYPPSASANGQLSHMLKKIGKDAMLPTIQHFFSCGNPYYPKVSHSLDALVKDCTKLWLDVQKRQGIAKPVAPTKAVVRFEYRDGRGRDLQDYAIGDPETIARKAVADYGGMIAKSAPAAVLVKIGSAQSRYSLAELQA